MDMKAIGFACTFFFDSGDITLASMEHGHKPQWTGATADGSHSTGKRGVVLHFYGYGKQVSEGVVVGMVLGSANAHRWMSVGRYFV